MASPGMGGGTGAKWGEIPAIPSGNDAFFYQAEQKKRVALVGDTRPKRPMKSVHVNFDVLRLLRLAFRDGDGEHTVLERGVDSIGIGIVREVEGSAEGAVAALAAVDSQPLGFFKLFALAANDEAIVFQGDFYLIPVDLWEISTDDVAGLILRDFDSGGPVCRSWQAGALPVDIVISAADGSEDAILDALEFLIGVPCGNRVHCFYVWLEFYRSVDLPLGLLIWRVAGNVPKR